MLEGMGASSGFAESGRQGLLVCDPRSEFMARGANLRVGDGGGRPAQSTVPWTGRIYFEVQKGSGPSRRLAPGSAVRRDMKSLQLVLAMQCAKKSVDLVCSPLRSSLRSRWRKRFPLRAGSPHWTILRFGPGAFVGLVLMLYVRPQRRAERGARSYEGFSWPGRVPAGSKGGVFIL